MTLRRQLLVVYVNIVTHLFDPVTLGHLVDFGERGSSEVAVPGEVLESDALGSAAHVIGLLFDSHEATVSMVFIF